jgi:hypothetical protein
MFASTLSLQFFFDKILENFQEDFQCQMHILTRQTWPILCLPNLLEIVKIEYITPFEIGHYIKNYLGYFMSKTSNNNSVWPKSKLWFHIWYPKWTQWIWNLAFGTNLSFWVLFTSWLDKLLPRSHLWTPRISVCNKPRSI